MTKYEEAYARCNNCAMLDKCADALCNVIWRTHIPSPEEINCEYFPELGEAIKEYTQSKIYEMFKKAMNKENQNV